ncbi:MAG: trigger factor, partial [Lachnospiraceae bacterium]|nr:trigger factor [Lachnospiraceae bacterium]
ETEELELADVPEGSVTLGEYKGLEITEPDVEVTDEQVESQIQYVLSSKATTEEVTGRPAQDGDIVNIDYVGMKDGVAFEGGTAEGYDLTLGSGSFIDGFEDGLIGANTGDEVSLNLTFPENYGNADLAGQAVVFDVTVNAIKEKKDAVLDDEFVKTVSETSKTVDEYRAEIRSQLEEAAAQNAEIQKQNEAMLQVIENATYEGLDEHVEAEFGNQLIQMNAALKQQGMELSSYATMFGMDEEGFKDYMRSDIENSIKVSLAAAKIAEQENLEVDDEARKAVAEIYGLESPEELVATYGQEAVDEAARNVKVMDFLIENAKIVENKDTAE